VTDHTKKAQAPTKMRRKTLGLALFISLLSTLYWSVIASDRYVSATHIFVQRTDFTVSQTVDFSSLLGNLGGNNTEDQMLLRDYLLSVDLLKKLDSELHLRRHYSDTAHDIVSRMWREDEPIEWFYRYFMSRVSVEYDDYSGVLVIRAQAYDPQTAQAITAMMVEEGERFINELSHRVAQDQVTFLEQQVMRLNERAKKAREALIQFQDREGLVSPEATVESRSKLIAGLDAKRAELQTERNAMLAYLKPNSPSVIQLDQQLKAIESQIEHEKAQLASNHKNATLNRAVEQFQRLEMEAQFAEETYRSALIALEKGRVEASRKLKKVSVLQSPSLPEYPWQPLRLYNSVVYILFALLIAGLIHLIAAIIRDHRD